MSEINIHYVVVRQQQTSTDAAAFLLEFFFGLNNETLTLRMTF